MPRFPPAFAAASLLAAASSCSLAPYAGIDQSRHQKSDTDWELARKVTGIPAETIARYRSGTGATTLLETRFLSQDFTGPAIFVVNFSPECDQTEGRPPAFHIRSRGPITVRDLAFKGTGHDGFHIHSGKRQGWDSESTVAGISFERCIFTACEDAVTVGFNTRDISFRNCIFVANPDGRFRDKLVQLNHAHRIRFIDCYFAPTKNAVEFKSGASISAERCTFDRCSTAWRVRTADSYRGIVPDLPTSLSSQNCTYRFAKQAFYLDGTVTASSVRDLFHGSRKFVAKRGALFHHRPS